MEQMKIIKAIAALDTGGSTYVEGNLSEIRALCDEIGSFYVVPYLDGQCKVTKAKATNSSFYGNIATQLEVYDGKPIKMAGDVQKVRIAVSRYNSINGKTFSVRLIDNGESEIFSKSVFDCRTITREVFDQEVAIRMQDIERLTKLVSDGMVDQAFKQYVNEVELEEEEDEDEAEQHDPSIFVTRANTVPEQPVEEWKPWRLDDCDTCGEEFSTQDKQQTTCDDCRSQLIDDDDDIV
jgi:hypothetical protein